MSVQFAIVPPSFTQADLELPSFRKKSHYYAKKDEHERLKIAGAIEVLDERRRIWRYKGISLPADAFRARSSRIYVGLSMSLRDLLRSEITRRPIEDRL